MNNNNNNLAVGCKLCYNSTLSLGHQPSKLSLCLSLFIFHIDKGECAFAFIGMFYCIILTVAEFLRVGWIGPI